MIRFPQGREAGRIRYESWAAEWVAGRRTDAGPEAIDFVLLRELPGYTRRTLNEEPAAVVRRWLAIINARERHAEQEHRRAALRMRGRADGPAI